MEQYTLNKEQLESIMYGYAAHIEQYGKNGMSPSDWMSKYGPATPAPQDVPVGLEQYAPTKEELLLGHTRAADHAKKWGGPADSHASYLTGFVHGIGYGRAQELKRVQEAQAQLIGAYDEYVKLLGKEIDSLIGIAHVHGWQSENHEAGVKLRERLVQLKSESPSLPVKEQTDWESKFKEANQFIIDLAKAFGQEGLGYDDLKWSIEDFQNAVKEQAVDPVAYSEWADLHAVRNGRHNWTVGTGNDKKHFTSDELLVFYTQSLQNKQP